MARRVSLLLLTTYTVWCLHPEPALYLNYEYNHPSIVLLNSRVKRAPALNVTEKALGTDEVGDDPSEAWKTPEGVERRPDGGDEKYDHQYYTMTISNNDTEKVKSQFVDMDAFLSQPGVQGNKSHPLLSQSYRRAVSTRMSFDFPFYGHKMRNLTIATGGFIYIGDQTHSWLAATQYIAPLMANFDTHLEGSNIIYADDGNKFVVEWRKVQLREQQEAGSFTFQVSLFKNGDIAFVYKDVAMDVSNISDTHHPCKAGVSDAYLFHHTMHGPTQQSLTKRVIYEYHRIEVPVAKIVSNSVVFLKAEPTCMSFSSCEECSNATLKHFECSWCHAKKKNGGAFCTDSMGLHRRRQHWIEGNCKAQQAHMYCGTPADDYDEVDEDDTQRGSTVGPSTPDVVPLPNKGRKGEQAGGTGYAFLVFALGSALVFIAWLAFAYYNPHTASGQLLIKYRPSRWRSPNGHVRYSASLHM